MNPFAVNDVSLAGPRIDNESHNYPRHLIFSFIIHYLAYGIFFVIVIVNIRQLSLLYWFRPVLGFKQKFNILWKETEQYARV